MNLNDPSGQAVAGKAHAGFGVPGAVNEIASDLTNTLPARRSLPVILAELFKARLTMLVLLTTMAGFYLGVSGGFHATLMLQTLLATALLAGGGAALNQFIEREYDARMRRTRERPIPSGELRPGTVLWLGSILSALGLVYLFSAAGVVTGIIGALTLSIYIFVYTPLKRVTWLNTLVGAVPGALPPLIGWTAARGSLSPEGLSLFAIQALWQIPHFMAIAWLYRDDYANAGFQMLPVIDHSGRRTGRQAVLFSFFLLPVVMLPFWFGLAGYGYLLTAAILGLSFTVSALRFARQLTPARARELFLVSVLYLPLLLAAMVLDKTGR